MIEYEEKILCDEKGFYTNFMHKGSYVKLRGITKEKLIIKTK